jgi:hypothetical protein
VREKGSRGGSWEGRGRVGEACVCQLAAACLCGRLLRGGPGWGFYASFRLRREILLGACCAPSYTPHVLI